MKKSVVAVVVLMFSIVGLAAADAVVGTCSPLLEGGASACVSYDHTPGPSFRFIGPGIYITEEGSYFAPDPHPAVSRNALACRKATKKRKTTKKCVCKAK